MQYCSILVIILVLCSVRGVEVGRIVNQSKISRHTPTTVLSLLRRRGRFHHENNVVLAINSDRSRSARRCSMYNDHRWGRLPQEETLVLCR